jgi:hypothetical protein
VNTQPDRKPDLHQVLTDEEITIAAMEYLRLRGRSSHAGDWYWVNRVFDVAAGTHQIKAWAKP